MRETTSSWLNDCVCASYLIKSNCSLAVNFHSKHATNWIKTNKLSRQSLFLSLLLSLLLSVSVSPSLCLCLCLSLSLSLSLSASLCLFLSLSPSLSSFLSFCLNQHWLACKNIYNLFHFGIQFQKKSDQRHCTTPIMHLTLVIGWSYLIVQPKQRPLDPLRRRWRTGGRW